MTVSLDKAMAQVAALTTANVGKCMASGLAARKRLAPASANPFAAGSLAAYAWHCGWAKDGRKVAQIEIDYRKNPERIMKHTCCDAYGLVGKHVCAVPRHGGYE